MSISQLQKRTNSYFKGTDADLLLRLHIALSVQKRVGWHLVNISVHNGVVQLAGVVPTSYDRELISSLVRHVAGVYGIEDRLTVGDAAIRQQLADVQTQQSVSTSEVGTSPNPFLHLPLTPQSLDDILAGQASNVVSTT